MILGLILFGASIPLIGLCNEYQISLEEQRSAGPRLVNLILSAICLVLRCIFCASILYYTLCVGHDGSPQSNEFISLPVQLIIRSTLLMAVIFFIVAIVVECCNQGNSYSAKKRSLKYAMQDFSGGAMALSAATFLATTMYGAASSLILLYPYCVAVLSTTLIVYTGNSLIKGIRRLIWAATMDDLPPNSKRLKALRRSLKS